MMIKLVVKLKVEMGVKVTLNSPYNQDTSMVVILVLQSRNSQTRGKSGQSRRMVRAVKGAEWWYEKN